MLNLTEKCNCEQSEGAPPLTKSARHTLLATIQIWLGLTRFREILLRVLIFLRNRKEYDRADNFRVINYEPNGI